MASDVFEEAVEQYVKCAVHYTSAHKGRFKESTASDVLDANMPYEENISPWHDLCSLVVQEGEKRLKASRPPKWRRCIECKAPFRKRVREDLDEFHKRDKCYKCERLYTKTCEGCGITYSKESRRSFASWEKSRFHNKDCQKANALSANAREPGQCTDELAGQKQQEEQVLQDL